VGTLIGNSGNPSAPTASADPTTGGAAGVTLITSTDGSVTVTNPGGPTVNLSVPVGAGGVSSIVAGAGISVSSATGNVTVTAKIATGVAGGQTAYGGTLTTQNLTLQPNFADTTTGRVVVIGLGVSFPNTGGPAAPHIAFPNTSGLYGTSNLVRFTNSGAITSEFGVGYVQVFGSAANTGFYVGSADAGLFLDGSHGLYIAVNNYTTHRLDILSTGAVEFRNVPFVSFTSSNTPIAQADGTVMEFGITPIAQTALAGTVLDAYEFAATTATFTGAGPITTAAGVNYISVEAPTYSDATAMTITSAATLAIRGAPIGGGAGPVTITNPYALWVQAGLSRFDGTVDAQVIQGTGANLVLQDAAALTTSITLTNSAITTVGTILPNITDTDSLGSAIHVWLNSYFDHVHGGTGGISIDCLAATIISITATGSPLSLTAGTAVTISGHDSVSITNSAGGASNVVVTAAAGNLALSATAGNLTLAASGFIHWDNAVAPGVVAVALGATGPAGAGPTPKAWLKVDAAALGQGFVPVF
jgi:hypothetical protein